MFYRQKELLVPGGAADSPEGMEERGWQTLRVHGQVTKGLLTLLKNWEGISDSDIKK